jgi:hypothetical protein
MEQRKMAYSTGMQIPDCPTLTLLTVPTTLPRVLKIMAVTCKNLRRRMVVDLRTDNCGTFMFLTDCTEIDSMQIIHD